jgi:outer membrane lipoprotein-sorting protein
MKSLKMGMLALLMLSGVATLKAQSVDEVMDKHLKAIGSKEAWNNIKSLKMDGGMSVQGMDIGVVQTMVPGKAMRMDISVMGMNGFTIVTKSQGWTYMPFQPGMDKLDTMKADALKASQSQMDLKAKEMFDYKTNGTKTEYLGMDTINKVLCYRIKFTDKDGNETTCYFDTKTYYLLRTESKVKVEEQEQEVAMSYDNYKALDGGVVMPMTISSPMGDINFKSIELNKPIDESIFKPTMPAASK